MFARRDEKGELYFAVPGYDVTSYDYLLKLSRREAPLTDKIDILNFGQLALTPCPVANCINFVLDMDRYLARRGDSRSKDWATWTAKLPRPTRDDEAARPVGSSAALFRASGRRFG